MDAAAGPETVLASSSSAIPASEYTAELKGRDRCLVAHPGNPPYLLPVVELVPSPWTAPAALDRSHRLFESVGQVPVRLNREIAGFVMNRLQAGVVCEAMSLVGQGIISPDDLDKVMRHSLGLRWSFMGPFETMDLNAPNGFQDYLDRYRIPYQKMGASWACADPWTKEASDAVLATRDSKTPRANLPARRALARPAADGAAPPDRRRPSATSATSRRASDASQQKTIGEDHGRRPQSHHHLRRHRLDPYADDDALSADHAGRDRRRRRSARPRRARRSCICTRAIPKDGRPTPGSRGVHAVPAAHQAGADAVINITTGGGHGMTRRGAAGGAAARQAGDVLAATWAR